MFSIGTSVAVISMLLIAVDGIIAKYMLRRFEQKAYATLVLAIGLMPMLAVQLFLGSQFNAASYWPMVLLGGIFLAFGYVFYFRALSRSQVSLVTIFSNVQSLIIFAFGIFFLKERISSVPLLGALLIFIGSSFGIYDRKALVNPKLVSAVLANVSWGIYWIFMAYVATSSDYITPILMARAIASTLLFAYYMGSKGNAHTLIIKPAAAKQPNRRRKKTYAFIAAPLLMLAIASLVDSGINISFGIVLSLAYVALGSAITSMAPILTAIIGRITFRDRLTKAQAAGLAIAVIGAILIAV